MAGTLICREDTPQDRSEVLDLIEAVYNKRPGDKIFPDDRLVVEEDGRIVGFAALYRLDDVVIGAVDWCAIEEGREEKDMVAILGALIEGMRDFKKRYALRAIMLHTPYDEIRQHLGAADLQVGEQKIRRLGFTNPPLQA
jgi:hypothetical protein